MQINNENFFSFKQERSLGAIITDTFKFIRFEWKQLLSMLISVTLIPILITFALAIYNGMDSLETENLFSLNYLLFIYYFLFVAIYYSMSLIINSYVKVYVENKGQVEKSEVYAYFKKHLLAYILMGVVSFLIWMVSIALCVLPGFYILTVLSVVGPVFVFQEKSVFDSIGYCFDFVKEKFWETLGTVLVVFLLIMVLGGVFSLTGIIYTMVKTATAITENNLEQINSLFSDPVYIVLTLISTLGQHILYGVLILSFTLIYFDIDETRNDNINVVSVVMRLRTSPVMIRS